MTPQIDVTNALGTGVAGAIILALMYIVRDNTVAMTELRGAVNRLARHLVKEHREDDDP